MHLIETLIPGLAGFAWAMHRGMRKPDDVFVNGLQGMAVAFVAAVFLFLIVGGPS